MNKGDSLKHAIAAFHADPGLKREPGARTLALQKLLRRFLDVCNAVAYAHSRGVLHRDLKPDNVMVGRYGETLVVDWGLAKAVGRSGTDGIGPLPESTVLYTSSGSAETMPGSVIGTPAYMSPEQAAGRPDLLGPASDVYSLGATLYTLLTGRAPFREKEVTDILRKVKDGEFPRPRESAPWLDPALEAITLKAMATRRDDRYSSPKTLAEDIESWLADEPVTAHREPWIRSATRWARKHRTAVTTVASTALVAFLLIAAYGWAIIDRTRRADSTGLATLDKVGFLEADARKSSDPSRWKEAIAEARRAEAQFESGGGSDATRSQAKAKLVELQEALRVVERDLKMVAELEAARLHSWKNGNPDLEGEAHAFQAAFRSYGIDLERLSNEEAVSRIRSSRITTELLDALDDGPKWETRWATLARLADTDARRAEIRDRIARKDFEGLRRLLSQEARSSKLGSLGRKIFGALASDDATASFPLLEAIHFSNRTDFWLTHYMARACRNFQPQSRELTIRYAYAATVINRTSPLVFINLGDDLKENGEIDAAITAFREAIRLQPDYAGPYYGLGDALSIKKDYDAAIAAFREAVRLSPPNYASSHYHLGRVLALKGDYDAAIVSYRAAIAAYRESIRSNEAIRLHPKFAEIEHSQGIGFLEMRMRGYAEVHGDLGRALQAKGELDAAIAAYRDAIRLKPDLAPAHGDLGTALQAQGQLEQAITEYRAAIWIKSDNAVVYLVLGNALQAQGQLDQAITEYRAAIRINPEYAEAHNNLGAALKDQGQLEQAITEYRTSIRINPKYAEAHNNLGAALQDQGQLEQAITEYRIAIRLKPDLAGVHCNLGLILSQMGKFGEGLESLEKGHALGTKQPGWRYPSEAWVRDARRLVDLEAKLPAILKGGATPRDSDERLGLADLCYKTGRYATSTRFWGEAFTETPALADDMVKQNRYSAACSASLAALSRSKDEPMPDDPAKAKLREQALGWLRADLVAWGKVLDGGNEPTRKQTVAKTLAHWKEDTDLAGLRDDAALAKLPEAEREAFRTLWADVEALRIKAGGGK